MMRGISKVGLLLMVAGAVALYYYHALFSRSPLTLALQALAVGLMVWARVTFGRRSFHAAANPTEGGLVTRGPYRYIRHPIYTAGCLFCWAGVASHPSAVSLGAGALVLAGAGLRMLAEERLLVERYPDYRQYADATKRMVPFVF
jgi:protein-S-isoprenylcysteine O-methyltransferase Ste14